MAVQLYRLRGVPEDEADQIRALLTANAIDYYETPGGNWGISMPALWLRDESQQARALQLIADYQRERARAAREAYREAVDSGAQPTLRGIVQLYPLRVAGVLVLIGIVLYVTIKPFLDLAR